MTYIVNDKCIMCKYTDCVEVCPVDCFYEGENMLAIHPDECIDCGVCEPECPPEAILPDTEAMPMPGWVNRELWELWPNITQRRDPLPEADAKRDEAGKFEKFLPEMQVKATSLTGVAAEHFSIYISHYTGRDACLAGYDVLPQI